MKILDELASEFRSLPKPVWRGQVAGALGMTIEVVGLERVLAVGDECEVQTRGGAHVVCETVGFRGDRAILMATEDLHGIAVGCSVRFNETMATIRPCDGWLGRIINAKAEPIDGQGPLPRGEFVVPLMNTPPNACARRPIGRKIDTFIRALDTMAPLCEGQRMGIFAGSGVGKSTLLSMLARRSSADVNVIGLIGERGREVNEFIVKNLGEKGLARSVVVVATADEMPLMRRRAAYLTMAIAEDQRKRGRQVLCMVDSITRFAMAQREIGLSAGEPPLAKGYPPTVFSELPRLFERAGPGMGGQGDITGVFTVLVEGDDHNEPIADAVRGLLDGHLVLSRSIAEQGRYPAIDLVRSISRVLPGAHSDWENAVRLAARKSMATYQDREELIRMGAYRKGSDAETDKAVDQKPKLDAFFSQSEYEATPAAKGFDRLGTIMGFENPDAADTSEASYEPDDSRVEIMEPEAGPLGSTDLQVGPIDGVSEPGSA